MSSFSPGAAATIALWKSAPMSGACVLRRPERVRVVCASKSRQADINKRTRRQIFEYTPLHSSSAVISLLAALSSMSKRLSEEIFIECRIVDGWGWAGVSTTWWARITQRAVPCSSNKDQYERDA
jgi:hypothetical protein